MLLKKSRFIFIQSSVDNEFTSKQHFVLGMYCELLCLIGNAIIGFSIFERMKLTNL